MATDTNDASFRPAAPSFASIPSSGPATPLTASQIGLAIGAAGGTVAQAAEFQYVLSRVAPNRRPTADEIGKILGLMGVSLDRAIISGMLLNLENK